MFDSSRGVSKSRYRYTGMERDEETGLQVHGVRYYAPWLGRWCSSDPSGTSAGINRYAYCAGPSNTNDVSGRAPAPGLQTDSVGKVRPTDAQNASLRAAATKAAGLVDYIMPGIAVMCVSFNDAIAFANALSERDHLLRHTRGQLLARWCGIRMRMAIDFQPARSGNEQLGPRPTCLSAIFAA